MSDLRDSIEQAISDSLDADWQPAWAANAIMELPVVAAAPALLEALEELDASWTHSFPKGPDGDYGAVSIADEHKALWQKARAAISLAKGESA